MKNEIIKSIKNIGILGTTAFIGGVLLLGKSLLSFDATTPTWNRNL